MVGFVIRKGKGYIIMLHNYAADKPTVIIVDACSTGRFFVHKFAGYNVIHVQSSPTPPVFFTSTFNPTDYAINIIYEGNVADTWDKLLVYNPKFVIAASEMGVTLTEKLLKLAPQLPQNNLSIPDARRNKYIMANCVAKNGVSIIPQIITTSCNEAIIWANAQQKWPVVVKDPMGSGACGFRLCQNANDVRLAFDQLYTSINDLGVPVDKLLVQQFIDGDEYEIDTVSYQGRHYIIDAFKYTKRDLQNGRRIFLKAELQTYEEIAGRPKLISCVYDVLDAIGIQIGAAHTEIMYTDTGPVLLESAARPVGAWLPDAMDCCVGYNQIDLTIDAYTYPEKLKLLFDKPYITKCFMTGIYLRSSQSGILQRINNLDLIRSLPTYFDHKMYIKIGEPILKTVDLDTIPGFIYLVGTDRQQLLIDSNFIQELMDKEILFKIALP